MADETFRVDAELNPAKYEAGVAKVTAANERMAAKANAARDAMAAAFDRVAASVSPVVAAQLELAEAQAVVNRAVGAGLVTDERATAVMAAKTAALRDQLDPFGALIAELERETQLLTMDAEARERSTRILELETNLRAQGVEVTAAQTAAIAGQVDAQIALQAAQEKSIALAAEQKEASAGVGGALLGALAIGEVVHLGDEYLNVSNKIRMTTKSQEELATSTELMFQVANHTRVSVEDTAAAYQRFSHATKDLNLTAAEGAKFITTLNEAVQISGVNAGEAKRGVLDLMHGMSQGALTTRELKMIMAQVPEVANVMQEALGVSAGQLMKMAKEGKLTSKAMYDLFTGQADRIEEEFGHVLPTITQRLVVLKNEAIKFFGTLVQSDAFQALGNALSFVSDHFDAFGKALVVVGEVLVVYFAGAKLMAAVQGLRALAVAAAANPFVALALAGVAVVGFLHTLGVSAEVAIPPVVALGAAIYTMSGPIGVAVLAGTALVAFVYHFRDAIADVLGAIVDNPFSELAGSILLLMNPITALIGAVGLLHVAYRALSSVFGAIGDFFSIDEPQFMLDARKAIEATNDALTNMQGIVNDLHFAFLTNTIVVLSNALDGLTKSIKAVQIATLEELGRRARETGRLVHEAVEEAKRQASAAASEVKRLRGELDNLRDAADAPNVGLAKMAKAIEQLEAARRAHLITAGEEYALIGKLGLKYLDEIDPVNALVKAKERELEILNATEGVKRQIADQDALDAAVQKRGTALTDDEAASYWALTKAIHAKEDALKAAANDNAIRAKADKSLAKREEKNRGPMDEATALTQAMEKLQTQLLTDNQIIAQGMVGGVNTLQQALVNVATTGKASFSTLFAAFFRDITEAIARALVLRAIMGAFGGGAIGNGTLNPFTAGGGGGTFSSSTDAAAILAGAPGAGGGTARRRGGGGGDVTPGTRFRATPDRGTGATPAANSNGGSATAVPAPAPVIHIHNVIDPNTMVDVMSTAGGARAVLNVIRANPAAVRAATR